MTPNELKRFEAKYVPVPYTGCWLWDGATNLYGYGLMARQSPKTNYEKAYPAHRLAYEHWNGPIPEGCMVRHTCDVCCCVNPEHLLVGTAKDNARDSVSRDRSCRGERNGLAKLSSSDVREIRRLRGVVTQKELARQFGVSRTTISHIHTNRVWAWLAPTV